MFTYHVPFRLIPPVNITSRLINSCQRAIFFTIYSILLSREFGSNLKAYKQMVEYKITTNGFSIVLRLGMFLLVWGALSNGDISSWWFGVPAVLIALITSVALVPPTHLVWYECIKFVPFFLKNSLSGGIDVAWRAFHPRLPITPDLIEYSLKLPPGLSQIFFANIVSLLPGTLSAALDGNTLKVHVLDSQKDFISELEKVEQHVARIFGLSLNIYSKGKSNETV